MRAIISGWMIADGEVADPVAGKIVKDLALRLYPAPDASAVDRVVVDGATTWSRVDYHNGLVESVIAADRCRLLWEASTADESLPAIGSVVRQAGTLHSVGAYEFEYFGIPDVRQSWLVLQVERVGVDDRMVELEPVEFRFDV
ncbi:MAG: hypothetical protein AAGC49_15630 [Brevundimonas sp.]